MEDTEELPPWEAPPTPLSSDMRDSLRIAMVCHSNVNRSMEAHDLAQRNGFVVDSYGIGKQVKLPGITIDSPNVFDFGTKYDDMFNALSQQDHARYLKNGMLHMLDRDRKVKAAAEKWQNCVHRYHVVICFELRVFDAVIDDLQSRKFDPHPWFEDLALVHVINLETIDNHRAAKVGAERAVQLVTQIYEALPDWEEKLSTILDDFENQHDIQLFHTILNY